ncbi:hypothetical protein G7077_08130 [Sphingomonas piscis]|uniref:DUF5681 domain-containing protein n=1 Tax=Sphingomonas piscis TaxID=2714943 RepID=A0A6G7YQ56_9SPHN|nr:DUF5681 domain-containing protein [Sphingomonas piscis]QIK78866.1 hypothetical protein G7077_08130 [Sphingomonas piscis]
MSGRFQKGQSGNPAGRPKARRPHISAFDVIIDKTLTVTQNGVERELTIDEALQLQTYQAALKGSKMAVRHVLKMIEAREVALAKAAPAPRSKPIKFQWENDARNADEAMLLLGITVRDPSWTQPCQYGVRMKMANWAVQAGLSRPGRRKLSQNQIDSVKWSAFEPDKLRWPRGARGE